MQVIGLETSCDETGVAVFDTDRGLLSHVLFSQVDLHAHYGGVVPELASRDHIRRLSPLTEMALEKAGTDLTRIDAVAYTAGPGLAGALMTGAVAGRSLAWALDVPALAVHHMEGHLLSPMLEAEQPDFPFVCLLVSGGHSQLYRVDGIGRYELLGDTLDDAAGEAFDKTAKLLGLPYPGGPHLAKLAENGDNKAYAFPRPMTDRPGLDFSFSGLKTAAITTYNSQLEQTGSDTLADPIAADIAASFQLAIVETLFLKCERALKQEKLDTLVVSGGVSANRCLRETFDSRIGARIYYPRLEFCTDNGAMIALAGALRLEAGELSDLAVEIRPRWALSELPPLRTVS